MDDSPPNNIPAEIRIKIYEAVLLVPKRVRLDYSRSTGRLQIWMEDHEQKSDSIALTAASKQLRQETLPILFGSNSFTLRCCTFNNLAGIGDVALAREASTALCGCPFVPYMKHIRVRLGCWLVTSRPLKDEVFAAASNTLKSFADAFPSPDVRLECLFSVQWARGGPLQDSRGGHTHRPIVLHMLRGEPESLIDSIRKAVIDRRQTLRRRASKHEQKRMRPVKVAAGVAARFAQVMATNPMWEQEYPEREGGQYPISNWDDGEDDGPYEYM